MIQYFIAIIVAIGFWSSMSKDQRRKVTNASWVRTIIYIALSYIVLVFYIRTNEIATIKQSINVNTKRGSFNPKTNVFEDSVFISIYNRFDNNNKFHEIGLLAEPNNQDRPLYQKDGKIITTLYLKKDTPNVIKDYKTQYPHLFEGLLFPNSGHLFNILTISSRIPTFSPFQADFSYDIAKPNAPKSIGNYDYYFGSLFTLSNINKYGGLLNNYGEEYYGKNAICSNAYTGTYNLDSLPKDINFIKVDLPIGGNIINTMNVFSAVDLSQCSFQIDIASDIPLKGLAMYFDVPVEMLPSKHNPTLKDAYVINFMDNVSLQKMNHSITTLHFKMPTQENLQIVRSLILTTILTALLSLAISNLVYACRKTNRIIAYKRRSKRKMMSYRKAHKFYNLWIIPHRIIILIIIILSSYLVYRGFSNNHIMVPINNLDLWVYTILIIILLIAVLSSVRLLLFLKNKDYDEVKDNEPKSENKLNEIQDIEDDVPSEEEVDNNDK